MFSAVPARGCSNASARNQLLSRTCFLSSSLFSYSLLLSFNIISTANTAKQVVGIFKWKKPVVDRYLSKLFSVLLCFRILQINKGAIILKSKLAQYRYLDFNALREVYFLKKKGLPIIIVIMILGFEYIWIL